MSLVNVSVQLTLDHLSHGQSISLLPSTEVLISPSTGPGVDKLDNSAWLLQLLSLIIQILQNSGPKLRESKGNETPAACTTAINQDQESSEVQEIAGSCCSNSAPTLSDRLVARKDVLMCLLECLNQCPIDKQGVLNSPPYSPVEKLSGDVKISGKPSSVEGGVLQLLSVIQSSVTELGVLVDGILSFLETPKPGNAESMSMTIKRLSDPLLWLLFKVLNTSQAVTQFYEKGEFYIYSLGTTSTARFSSMPIQS